MTTRGHSLPEGIAVVGMSGRYPGARNVEQFWEILRDGKETISYFTDEQLLEAGFDPDMVRDPSFVKARPVYERPMDFDAPFFGYTPREAEIIDPQQRVFLECAWEALEDAGYDPLDYPGAIGLFGGSGMTYYLFGLIDNQRVMSTMGGLAVTTSNEKDYFATRAGYKLNLRGPCVTVQTACSTAHVGIIFGCQSLLTYQTDIALAGGATIAPSQIGGYYYTEGGIVSQDGHNRAFDASGQGTIFGSGAGVVVLKRLKDAIADGDAIHAVIRGFGINNDGSAKVGFTAPGVDGQASVCLDALAMSGIHPETVNYVECHGTATPLGDLVEITALSKAYRAFTDRKQYCAVGSVKTNIGHMDAAAGIAGFTKAVLALKHRQIPPSLHFEKPNPQIDFGNSPFYVNTKLSEMKRHNGTPLRAGVSSFGVGGTNAHLIIEEAPVVEPTSASRPWQLLVWSAKTSKALDNMTANLADHLERHPELSLADVAFTLQVGRRTFAHRRALACRTREEAIAALRGNAPGKLLTLTRDQESAKIAFLFPGQGAQHPNMGREVYENEPIFREHVDRCCEVLKPILGSDLRDVLYPAADRVEQAEGTLTQTRFAQPALFVIEYALARLWMQWGIEAEAMVGHSIGEYVAACLAGVFSLEDALKLVAERGALMQGVQEGSMLGVLLSETEIQPWLAPFANLSIAAVNAPSTCVVSGPTDQIDALEQTLVAAEVPARRLHTSHAFHSAMMDPILDEFRKVVRRVKLSAPRSPYLSNLTGGWATAAQATDPEYWVNHLRQPVRFSENVAALLETKGRVLVEVGPGRTLGSLVTQHPSRKPEHSVLASLPHPKHDPLTDLPFLFTTAGRLWLEGKPLTWGAFYTDERRRRISLPTYPFDHEQYFVDLAPKAQDPTQISPKKIPDISKWFHYPSWKRVAPLPAAQVAVGGVCMIFLDECGIGEQIEECLEAAFWEVITIKAGDEFSHDAPLSFTIRPGVQDDYNLLLQTIADKGLTPTSVIHLWSVTADTTPPESELAIYQDVLDRGFMSVFYLAPALNAQFSSGTIRMSVISSDMHDVTGNGVPLPSKAAVIGPCRAILAECPNIDIRTVDISVPATEHQTSLLIDQLLAEVFAPKTDDVIAYRGGHRWTQVFEPMKVETPSEPNIGLRDEGVYLITGGLGGVGIVLAEGIAQRLPGAKLALFSRSGLPPREQWEALRHGDDLAAERIRRVLRMEALGAEVMAFGADVSNLEQMRDAIANVERCFGSISGVIHSAGVGGGGIMLLKSKEALDTVLQPKIRGTLVLEELLKNRKLDFFLLCSSLNAFLGEGGISDYIGANAFLDAFAHSRKDWATPPVSIQWDSWEDVGMVAEGWFDRPKAPKAKPVVEPLDHPFFSSRFSVDGTDTYVVNLSPEEHWVVGEHVLMGTPTLVGTTHLQFAHTAFSLSHGEGPIEMRDVLFLGALVMKGETTREVHVVLEPERDGFRGFQVKSCKNGEWQTHALGRVGYNHDDRPVTHDVDVILRRCNAMEEQVDTKYAPNLVKAPFLQFGDRWRNMESKAFGQNEALGIFGLGDEFAHDFDVYGLHPAVLDRATGFACFRAGAPGAHYLPFAYNRVRVSGKLTQRCYSYVRFQPGNEYISSNVTIVDEQGNQLIQIDGYEVKRVAEELLEANDAEAAGGSNRPQPAAAAEPPKAKKVAARILSEDGIEVFRRILTLKSLPQVTVACRDLRAVQAEIRGVLGARGTQAKSDDQTAQTFYARPELATPYEEPRNDLERALADIWRTMLGLEKVGINDDFLELGGNSLLGIQIASRIRADFEIELSAATFYKSPTVALLAASIIETLQAGLDESALSEALDEIEAEAATETTGAAA